MKIMVKSLIYEIEYKYDIFITFNHILIAIQYVNQNSKQKTVAENLPKESTTILMDWLIDNHYNAYPDYFKRSELSKKSDLSLSQVSNWFRNIRARKWYKEKMAKRNTTST